MRKETSVVSLPTRADHHDHAYHQLVFGLEGDTEFDLAGDCRAITAGWGCLLPTSTDHMFHGLETENQIVVVNLPILVDDADQQARIEQLFRRAEYFNCPPDMMLLLRALSREMLLNPDDELLQDACASTLICSLQRHLEQRQQMPRQQGQLNLQLINDYIDLHMGRRISVDELAGSVCLSSSQFYYRFRAQTGYTPQQHVLERRLEAVRLGLINTDCPLSQLANDFGFATQSALTRCFTARYGLPPARYRRKHQLS